MVVDNISCLFKWILCCKQEKDRVADGEWMEPIPRPAADTRNTKNTSEINPQQGKQSIQSSNDISLSNEGHSGDKELARQLWTQAVNKVIDLDLNELDTSENDQELMRGLPTNLKSFKLGSAGDIEMDMGSDSDDDSVLEAAKARSRLKVSLFCIGVGGDDDLYGGFFSVYFFQCPSLN